MTSDSMESEMMKEQWKVELVEWGKAIGLGIIIVFIIRTFLFSSYVVEGKSMMPTLDDGNKLMVNKIGVRLLDLERFDVVVFHHNDDNYVKRIIGLPGDRIQYVDDTLYVNGKKFEEPYLEKYKKSTSGKLTGDFTLEELTGEKIVPEGKVFVLGDNRRKSYDSRHFGFVDIDQLVGTVNVRYWPLNEIDMTF
jgi:signal peptidase I